MKRRYLMPLLAALVLASLLLTACGTVYVPVEQETPGPATPASDTDFVPSTPPASDTDFVPATPPASETDLTAPVYITEQEALAVALKHANAKETEITALRIVLDASDPVVEYDVEFYLGAMEYDYEIDAVSGEILSFEKEARDKP